jgi:hypothetical protein
MITLSKKINEELGTPIVKESMSIDINDNKVVPI